MRTILRVGITVGGVAFVVLYPLQSAFGLAIAPGIVLAGLVAGLGTAKWLERPWYGRQFDAGLRTGVIAAGMAGVSVLLASLTQGSHPIDQLTANSHLIGIDLGPVISHLTSVGSAGVDILVVALATCLGVALAIVTTELGAFGKNRHAIQVVNQARLAAQAGLHGEASPAPVVSPPSLPTAVGIHSVRAVQAPSDTPAPARGSGAGGRPVAPAPATPPGNQRWAPPQSDSERFQPTEPALPVLRPQGHRSSKARPADSQLTEAMREALATWASDSPSKGQREPEPETPGTPDPRVRAPQPSAYLNSSPPVPSKRARKKQDTEWIR
jgi:hypothetical protein